MPLISDSLETGSLMLYGAIYALICLPIALLLSWNLPPRYKKTFWINSTFFYFLVMAIFILGLVIAIAIVVGFRSFGLIRLTDKRIQSLGIPDYQYSPIRKIEEFGEGAALKVLKKGELSKTARQKMLVAINQFSSAESNKMNFLVLKDDLDELRLYAKSLLEKQERELSAMIKQIDTKLAMTKDKKLTLVLKKRKALLLWEQVYKYLVHSENVPPALEKIKALALEVVQQWSEDAELPLLLAKIELRNRNLNQASFWLERAERNHAPDYKVASYKAEIDFLQKNYSRIASRLMAVNMKGVFGLQPMISFWVRYD